MEEEIFETKIKLSKFWLMLYNCFIIFVSCFILYRIWLDGTESLQQTGSMFFVTELRRIFMLCELIPLIEFVHHFVGFQTIKRHIGINQLINIWIIFGVIDFYPNNPYVMHWVILRCCNKIIRHFYNAFLAMDLKYEVFIIDYIRMTSFYLFYILEYVYSLILVFITLPKVNYYQSWSYVMPNSINFNFDYKIVFFFYICASIPNFLNTFIYLHRKRKEQLQYAKLHRKFD